VSIRGIGDAYAFQRLLWLLIGTVIVPTALLAVYGVYAIRNTRAALVQRGVALREVQLQGLAADLVGEIERLDGVVRERLPACPPGPCAVDEAGVAAVWTWVPGGLPPSEIAGIGLSTSPKAETVWIVPPDASAPVGMFASDVVFAAWQLDMAPLQALVARVGSERHPGAGVFSLEPAAPGPLPAFDEMMRAVQPEERTSVPLRAPLAGWEVALDPAPGSGDGLGRVTLYYLFGLVALVVTVITGTVFVMGSTLREIRLSRLQTDFVSNVSHELRTPLTSIKMFVDTLQSGRLQDPAKVKEALGLLSAETDRLQRRIERVLDWARMEAGRRVYEVEEVPVKDVVDEVLRAVRTAALPDTRDGEIEVRLPSDLPPLHGDRDALVEALLNLVNNAVRYTEAPRRIVVSAERKGRRVGLSVEDNGPGIPRRDRKRIWEKFYQGEEALLTRHEHGSGLGLAIVRAIVQGHGGSVDLASEVGRGSRFTIWLPCG